MKDDIVLRQGRYTIISHEGLKPGETLYSAYFDYDKRGKKNLVLGMRKSLSKAKEDLGGYIRSGGYEKWDTIEGLLKKEKSYTQGWSLDPEIRDIIKRLNEEGFETTGSCAGHIKGEEGFVTFTPKSVSTEEDRRRLREILKEYGITEIKFSKEPNYVGVKFPAVVDRPREQQGGRQSLSVVLDREGKWTDSKPSETVVRKHPRRKPKGGSTTVRQHRRRILKGNRRAR